MAGLVIGSFADVSVTQDCFWPWQSGRTSHILPCTLIIFGFVSLSIACLNSNASKVPLLTFALALRLSSWSAVFGMAVGYEFFAPVEHNTPTSKPAWTTRALFTLKILCGWTWDDCHSCQSWWGLSVVWLKVREIVNPFDFQQMVILLVQRICCPFFHFSLLPTLAYWATREHHHPVARIAAGYFHCDSLSLRVALCSVHRRSIRVKRCVETPRSGIRNGVGTSVIGCYIALPFSVRKTIVRKEISGLHCVCQHTPMRFRAHRSFFWWWPFPHFTARYPIFRVSDSCLSCFWASFAIGRPVYPEARCWPHWHCYFRSGDSSEAATALLINHFALQDSLVPPAT